MLNNPMTLKLHNTLTRKKEPFTPIDSQNVRMYVCGPTVYARPHIGNARSVVVYDVLYRLLKHSYGDGHVTYARNITDVDDKINKAATETSISIQELTKEVTAEFHEDMDALNCLRPTIEPRATEHITEIITMIEKLIKNGNAYAAEGHVLFDVTSDPNYGSLSRRPMDEMIAGARVEVAPYKKNPGDFVLWKPSHDTDDESSKFESPWGVGRPGWHIECSAMSTKHLGETFDIHGGGADLMFPHHENELAQSCCTNPQSDYVKYWVHNGFLTVDGEKMSKSLGNFTTVKELLDQGIHGEVIRFALLSTHYRKPLDWNKKLVEDAKNELDSYVKLLNYAEESATTWQEDETTQKLVKEFYTALMDDLNISKAKVSLHQTRELLKQQKDLSQATVAALTNALREMTSTLGIATEAYSEDLETKSNTLAQTLDVNSLIQQRTEAKAAKNWAEADRIRDELKAQGIILEDRPDGTTDWRHE